MTGLVCGRSGRGMLAAAVLLGSAPCWAQDKPASAPSPAVPVTTAKAQVMPVPVYFDGLGTVQAFKVVQIKAQVNGILTSLPAREGQEVQQGDVVAEIDPRPYQAALDQATAQRGKDVATLKGAQLDLERYRTLAAKSFAAVQQVDDQQATVSSLAASIAADEAAIETAKINLGYCVIRAPFAGRVSLYQVDVGNLIQSASQTGIISITQDKPIAVVFTLPESNLPKVQDARARGGDVPVLVQDGSTGAQLATGKLLTPNNTIDTSTGTISLKAEFTNQDDHLWPGQFVNARIQVAELPKAVVIPTEAIEHGPNGLFVYFIKPDQTVDVEPIEVGYQDDGKSVVTKGLAGSEAVVVFGQSRLAPGTKVRARSASAQGADSPAGSSADTASD